MSIFSRTLSEILGLGVDEPVPQIPDLPPPPYLKPPDFPHGKPWVLDEDAWLRWEAAGFPDDLSGL